MKAILFALLFALGPDVTVFIDCMEVTPGIPACSGAESLASGLIAFVAQRGPNDYPEVAQVARLDGDGGWHLESEGQLRNPVWSPSGHYIAWDRWQPFHPPMAYAWPDRPLVTDSQGCPVAAVEATNLDLARPRFLSAEQSNVGSESVLLRDSTHLLALPLPEGRLRRMPIPSGWVREFDWLLAKDGSLVALGHLRSRQDPERPQHLSIREHWWDGAFNPMALQTADPVPYLQLVDWSPNERWLLAAEVHDIYSNSQPRYQPFVRIDLSTGSLLKLPLRTTEMRALFVRGDYSRPWRPGGGNQILIPGMPLDPTLYAESQGEVSRLALVDLADGSVRWLTDDRLRVTSPAWSPDGRHIAFAALESNRELPEGWPMLSLRDTFLARRRMALYLLELETGNVRRITEPGVGWDSGPEWSADGSRLLYMRGFDPQAVNPVLRSRFQVRVWTLADDRDELILDHVDRDWAWWEGGR